jgi:deoxyribose-phosphate aldolase
MLRIFISMAQENNLEQKISKLAQELVKRLPQGVHVGDLQFSDTYSAPIIKSAKNIASFIDHTLLAATATAEEVRTLCEEAKAHKFFSVCVNPSRIMIAKDSLRGSSVQVATVVGFPLGANLAFTKYQETEIALNSGANEIDMVLNIGAMKDKNFKYIFEEISEIKKICGSHILKVILETAHLSEGEIIQAGLLAKWAGVDFLKTSTGFAKEGATVAHVEILRKIMGMQGHVKASGGIRTTEQALAMIAAGADRLGCSASVAIVSGGNAGIGNY